MRAIRVSVTHGRRGLGMLSLIGSMPADQLATWTAGARDGSPVTLRPMAVVETGTRAGPRRPSRRQPASRTSGAVSFLGSRLAPTGAFWVALAGGVAVARAAARGGLRLGHRDERRRARADRRDHGPDADQPAADPGDHRAAGGPHGGAPHARCGPRCSR